MKLQHRLLIRFLAVIVLPVSVTALLSVTITARQLRKHLNARLSDGLKGIELEIAAMKDDLRFSAHALAGEAGMSTVLRDGDRQKMLQMLDQAQSVLGLDSAEIVSPEGTVLAAAHQPARHGHATSSRSAIEQLGQDEASVRVTRSDLGVSIEALARVLDAGNALGTVRLARALDYAFLKRLKSKYGLDAVIYDRDRLQATTIHDSAVLGDPDLAVLRTGASDGDQTVMDEATLGRRRYRVVADPVLSEGGEKLGVMLFTLSSEETRRTIVLLSCLFGGVALALTLVAVAISVQFAARVVRPIQALADLTQDVAQGDLAKRADVAGDDEVGELARAFNRMAEDLAETTTSVENLNKEIAERRQVEEQLRTSEERYRLLAENVSDVIYTTDLNHRPTYVSPSVERLRGVTVEEALQESLEDILTPESVQLARDAQKGELERDGGQDPDRTLTQELEARCKDGSTVWLEFRSSFLRDAEGNPIGVLGVSRDIGERKQADEELRQSERRFREIFNATGEAIFVHDAVTGAILDVNRSALDIFGYTREEMAELTVNDLSPGKPPFSQVEAGEKIRLASEEGPQLFEWRSKRKNGELFWTEVHLRSSTILGRDCVLAVVRNVDERRRAQEALRESEERYRSLFEHASDAIFLMEEDRFVDCNPRTLEMFGCAREDIIAHRPYEFSPERQPDGQDSKEKALGKMSAAFAGEPQRFEWQHCRLDRTPFDADVSLSRFQVSGRAMLLAFVRDITERKAAEEALRASEEKFRVLAENVPGVIYLCKNDEHNTVTFVNDEIEALTGYATEDFLEGRVNFTDRYHAEDALDIPQAIDRALDAGGPFHLAYRIRHRDGRWRWVEEHGVGVLRDGELLHIEGFLLDITDRKQAEEKLRLTQFAIDHVSDAAFWIRPDGRFDYVNTAACDLLGYSEAELLTLAVPDIDADHDPSVFATRWKEIKDRRSLTFESQFRHRDGRAIPVEITASSIDFEGSDYVCAFARDVTERKEAERQVEEARALLLAAIEHSPAGILIADAPDVRIRVANSAALGIRGDSNQPLTDIPVELHPQHWQTFHPDGTPFAPEALPLSRAVLKGETTQNVEAVIRRPDGEDRYVLANAAPVRNADGDIVAGVVVFPDITERRHATEELRRSEEHFRTLVQNMPVVCFTYDRQGRFLSWNRAAEDVYGYTEDEAVGVSAYDLIVTEATKEATDEVIRRTFEGEVVIGSEWEDRNKDGTTGWRMGNTFPLLTVDGSVECGVNLNVDITDRKRTEVELQKLNEELEQRVRDRTAQLTAANQDLKEFAYVVSHDLKAPRRGIGQLAQWLTEDHKEALDEQGQEFLTLMMSRVRRMDQLIDGVLSYSRVGRVSESRQEIDLSAVVDQVIDLLSPPAEIQVAVEGALPTIYGDRTQVQQVFQNLLGNAIKFMDKPEGLVSVGCRDLGPHWRFTVRDNGPGIDPKYHEKVFGVFQTLRPRDEQEGTGIGLALVKKIVESYGGSVELESQPGEGACFSFTWPK